MMSSEKGKSMATQGRRVAILIALPQNLWERIRDEARDLGVGPSKVIEPVLQSAFGDPAERSR